MPACLYSFHNTVVINGDSIAFMFTFMTQWNLCSASTVLESGWPRNVRFPTQCTMKSYLVSNHVCQSQVTNKSNCWPRLGENRLDECLARATLSCVTRFEKPAMSEVTVTWSLSKNSVTGKGRYDRMASYIVKYVLLFLIWCLHLHLSGKEKNEPS
jgi:hypothetical protein